MTISLAATKSWSSSHRLGSIFRKLCEKSNPLNRARLFLVTRSPRSHFATSSVDGGIWYYERLRQAFRVNYGMYFYICDNTGSVPKVPRIIFYSRASAARDRGYEREK